MSGDGRPAGSAASVGELRHDGDAMTKEPFRLTLVCHRRDDGWRIAHLHASKPVG